MDDVEIKALKSGRKPARKSVIEAIAGAPMPIVETAHVEEPVTQPELAEPVSAPETTIISARVDEPAAPPAAVPAQPTVEDMTMDATTTIETATAHTETMFADVNSQAKGAMEKTAKMAEELAAFNKGNLEAMVESSKIIARGFESLGQDVAAFAKSQLEQSTAMMKTLASVKSPTEFMKVQSDMIRQSFDQMVAQSSRSTETMLKLAGEVAQPISNRMAVAADKMKLVAA